MKQKQEKKFQLYADDVSICRQMLASLHEGYIYISTALKHLTTVVLMYACYSINYIFFYFVRIGASEFTATVDSFLQTLGTFLNLGSRKDHIW